MPALARTVETVVSGSLMSWATYREGRAATGCGREIDAVLQAYVTPARTVAAVRVPPPSAPAWRLAHGRRSQRAAPEGEDECARPGRRVRPHRDANRSFPAADGSSGTSGRTPFHSCREASVTRCTISSLVLGTVARHRPPGGIEVQPP